MNEHKQGMHLDGQGMVDPGPEIESWQGRHWSINEWCLGRRFDGILVDQNQNQKLDAIWSQDSDVLWYNFSTPGDYAEPDQGPESSKAEDMAIDMGNYLFIV